MMFDEDSGPAPDEPLAEAEVDEDDDDEHDWVCGTCMFDNGPQFANDRQATSFADRYSSEPVDRALTPEEVQQVALQVEEIVKYSEDSERAFAVAQLLPTLPNGDSSRYARQVLELLQQLSSAGVIARVEPVGSASDEPVESRRFRPTSQWMVNPNSPGAALLALGFPAIAHYFAELVVRVHVTRGDTERIVTGLVLGLDRIITCAEPLFGADSVRLSWYSHWVLGAAEGSHVAPDVNLAVLSEPRFHSTPNVWLRRPVPGEEVMILAYARTAGSAETVMQQFAGVLSIDASRAGPGQVVVRATMPADCIGGPIFARDGRVLGIVARPISTDGGPEPSLWAAIPAEVIRRTVGALPPPRWDEERYKGDTADILTT